MPATPLTDKKEFFVPVIGKVVRASFARELEAKLSTAIDDLHAVMGAMGYGANEKLWRPGESLADAIKRLAQEKGTRVANLESGTTAQNQQTSLYDELKNIGKNEFDAAFQERNVEAVRPEEAVRLLLKQAKEFPILDSVIKTLQHSGREKNQRGIDRCEGMMMLLQVLIAIAEAKAEPCDP